MPVKSAKTVIGVKDLSFTYGGNPILERISFEVKAGDYVGIIGPNGGGKTTLLKLMLGLLSPATGSVTLGDRDRIGYVPQRGSTDDLLFPATVEEVIASGRTATRGVFSWWTKADQTAVTKAMKTSDVSHLAKRRIGTLSGGERQRVLIARALAGEPVVLMLDEPTAAVDAPSQEAFYAFLQKLHKQGLTIVIVSHDVDIITHEVSTVLCLNRHLVCHGPANEVMEHSALEKVYGKQTKIMHQH